MDWSSVTRLVKRMALNELVQIPSCDNHILHFWNHNYQYFVLSNK